MCCYCKQSGCAAATVRAFPLPGTWNRAECATQAGWRVTGDAGCRRRRRAEEHEAVGDRLLDPRGLREQSVPRVQLLSTAPPPCLRVIGPVSESRSATPTRRPM